MIEKKDIIKMARHVLKRARGRRDHQIMHPEREWLVGLLGFVVVVGVGSYWVWQQFERYSNLDPVGGESAVVSVAYRGEIVQAAIDRFGEKTDMYEGLVGAQIDTSVEELIQVETTETVVTDERATSTESATQESDSELAESSAEITEEPATEDEQSETEEPDPVVESVDEVELTDDEEETDSEPEGEIELQF
ncbi:MAG: hypothetical protein AAGA35_02585 [Patescibacteria group bacterium]